MVRHDRVDHVCNVVLALVPQLSLQVGHRIKVILDGAFGATRDKNKLCNASLDGLLDRILDQRLVDDGQKLFRHRLGGGKKARAQTREGKDGFADGGGIIDEPYELFKKFMY